MRVRRAFTLIEVLLASALFGLAAAGLFMALQPAHDALVRLSETTADTGALAVVRAIAESSRDRAALEAGGDAPLPGGEVVRWRATPELTGTEYLYCVRLTGERAGAPPLTATYLHFEPRWAEASEGTAQWLEHEAGIAASAGSGRPGGESRPGGKPGAESGRPAGAAPGERPGPAGERPQGGMRPGSNPGEVGESRPDATRPGGAR